MNRNHRVLDYINIYDRLKKINKEIEFSSDFIVAYPGEEEVDFNETLNLLKYIKFINSFSFIFSPRPGTKASNFNLIENEVAKNRLLILQEKLFFNQREFNKSKEGKLIEVLTENKLDDQNKLFGRNKFLNSVIFDGDSKNIGN